MVRPSYVLGGRGMEVVYDDESMVGYMKLPPWASRRTAPSSSTVS